MSSTHPAPIIGITSRNRDDKGAFKLSGNYVDAIRAVGGVPILLTPGETQITDLLRVIDGLVFSGGGDISPECYGGQDHPMVKFVCNERDAFEMALAREALQWDLPILGICRGMQMLTIVCGGALYPHVPDEFSEVEHFNAADRQPIRHDVTILPETRLAEITQLTELSVVSWHHQAIRSVPEGWRITASCADDLIEGIEHLEHPWAQAVQWHPEFSAEEPGHRRIFEAFLAAVQHHKLERSLQQTSSPHPSAQPEPSLC